MMLHLNKSDRAFFRLVNLAASCNPFSDHRMALDQKIVGGAPGVSGDELVDLVIDKVLERLQGLAKAGKANLDDYENDDRKYLHSVLLFDVYYRFADQFDDLILEQIDAGTDSCQVPFAREALRQLCQRGCSEKEAIRYFAFFYQLRRAFFFIQSSLPGQSRSMGRLRCQLWNAVFTSDISWYELYLWNRMEDFSTLILGETGTGKGTAAGAIGRSGFIPFDERRNCFAESFVRNFIGLNLSQFPETLIESELFGHKKGAFTGAIDDHQGILALCAPHGSIFLDEIGDASVPVQIKLLQVLQERTFSPLGGRETCRFHGRVIAATNKPLTVLAQQGAFREDFFYRLCTNLIEFPTLRQRIREEPSELDDLIAALVARTLGENLPDAAALVREVLERDLGPRYPWPGNVRELEQAVRRILLTRSYRGNDFICSRNDDLQGQLTRGICNGDIEASQLLAGYCELLYRQHQSFEEVGRLTGLDWRTVKKHVARFDSATDPD